MTPITKEMTDEKKDEMISQALRAPENAVLVQNLLDRGMTESDLLGRAELREAAEQSPKEIKERVREFLERLNAELPQAKAEQAPSEVEPLEKTAGHEQAPAEVEPLQKTAGHEEAPTEVEKIKSNVGHEQAPSEVEPLEKTPGHEQAPAEMERPGMRHEHRTAEAEKKKKDNKT